MAIKLFAPRIFARLALVALLPSLTSCAFFIGLFRAPDEQNVLVNGSFEDGAFRPDPPVQNNLMSVKPDDDTTITAWQVIGNRTLGHEIAWAQNGNGPGIITTDGRRFVDLTGTHDKPINGPFGGVRQRFPTASGFDYRVRFNVGASSNYAGPVSVTVRWSTAPDNEKFQEQTCGPFDPHSGAPPWNACELKFRATSADTFLTISGAKGSLYIGLDSVFVDCYAPLGRHDLCRDAPF